MDQDTRWLNKYEEVVSFIETNHRNPSKYVAEELLALTEQYRRKNQWE